jgi:hypothetical protein
MEFLVLCSRLWPIVAGILSVILYLGALHQMVNTNNKAITRLFGDIDALNKFMNQQEIKNGAFEKGMDAFKVIMNQFMLENAHAHGEIMIRIDKMFEWLGKNSK